MQNFVSLIKRQILRDGRTYGFSHERRDVVWVTNDIHFLLSQLFQNVFNARAARTHTSPNGIHFGIIGIHTNFGTIARVPHYITNKYGTLVKFRHLAG